MLLPMPLVRYEDEVVFLNPTKVHVEFEALVKPQVTLTYEDSSVTKHELISLNYMDSNNSGKDYRIPILFVSKMLKSSNK